MSAISYKRFRDRALKITAKANAASTRARKTGKRLAHREAIKRHHMAAFERDMLVSAIGNIARTGNSDENWTALSHHHVLAANVHRGHIKVHLETIQALDAAERAEKLRKRAMLKPKRKLVRRKTSGSPAPSPLGSPVSHAFCPRGTRIQTLIFHKPMTRKSSVEWAKRHGFRVSKVHATGKTFRLRQEEPGVFVTGKFRVIQLAGVPIQAVVGCPR